MATTAPKLLPLANFLALKTAPKRLAPLLVTRAERRRLLSKSEKVDFNDLMGLLMKGVPTIEFTPWPPDYVAIPRCWSSDPNIACVPRVTMTPFGPEFLGCDCFRTGVDESGGPSVPSVTPIKPLGCRLGLTITGQVRCVGQCADAGKSCTPLFAIGPSGVITVACFCFRRPRPTPR